MTDAGRRLTLAQVVQAAASADVVLIGEVHGAPAIHEMQAAVLSQLAALERPVALGIEYLPRSAQPLLDAYAGGHLDEAAFLAGVDWAGVWGFEFAAYRGLFETARARAIPIVALNIDRAFVRQVARQGFAAAAASGAPIDPPAPPTPAYATLLQKSFAAHGKASDPGAAARFIEAQQSWDRAMAETIAQALSARPGVRIVATMGAGHVQFGHGVAHQLAALGNAKVYTITPTDGSAIAPGIADALFTLADKN
jgi:uncharacterized iron-regulated protein